MQVEREGQQTGQRISQQQPVAALLRQSKTAERRQQTEQEEQQRLQQGLLQRSVSTYTWLGLHPRRTLRHRSGRFAANGGLIERRGCIQADVRRAQTPRFVGLAQIEHPVALYGAPRAAHGRDVCKDIATAPLRPDEAKSLLVVPASQLTA